MRSFQPGLLAIGALIAWGCAEPETPPLTPVEADAVEADAPESPPGELWVDLDGDGVAERLPDDVEDRRVPPPETDYDDELVVQFPAVVVPAGAEIFTCVYGVWEGPERGIVNSQFASDPSSNHHFIVNSVADDEVTGKPMGEQFKCADGDHAEGVPLYNWVKGGEERGIGAPLKPGQRYYAELHNLNPYPHPILVNAVYRYKLVPPEQVTIVAQPYMFGPADIRIPPGYHHVKSDCVWPQDTSILIIRAHMHLYGVRYALDWTSNGVTTRLFEVDPWLDRYFQEDQPSLEFEPGELQVKAGDVFTTHCIWENTKNEDVVSPEEMCNTFGVAYPLDGPLECDGPMVVVD